MLEYQKALLQTFFTRAAGLVSLHFSDFFFKLSQLLFYFRNHIFDFLGVWSGIEAVIVVIIDIALRSFLRFVVVLPGFCREI